MIPHCSHNETMNGWAAYTHRWTALELLLCGAWKWSHEFVWNWFSDIFDVTPMQIFRVVKNVDVTIGLDDYSKKFMERLLKINAKSMKEGLRDVCVLDKVVLYFSVCNWRTESRCISGPSGRVVCNFGPNLLGTHSIGLSNCCQVVASSTTLSQDLEKITVRVHNRDFLSALFSVYVLHALSMTFVTYDNWCSFDISKLKLMSCSQTGSLGLLSFALVVCFFWLRHRCSCLQ